MTIATASAPPEAGVLTSADVIAQLESRLERGFEVLEAARASGHVDQRWVDEWIRILRRYEALIDQQQAA